MPAVAARFARPARRYEEVVAFYRDLVGLPVIASFGGHEGYTGTIFGLPDSRSQLEIISHSSGEPIPSPTEEDMLVLYFASESTRAPVMERFADAGHVPVPLTNPYWTEHGAVGYVDPDGWRLVLVPAPWGA